VTDPIGCEINSSPGSRQVRSRRSARTALEEYRANAARMNSIPTKTISAFFFIKAGLTKYKELAA
jgi:hypothetical protein